MNEVRATQNYLVEVHREPSLEQLVMNKIWVIHGQVSTEKKHGQIRLVLYVKGISIHISFLMRVGFQLSHHLPCHCCHKGRRVFPLIMDKPRIPLGRKIFNENATVILLFEASLFLFSEVLS